MIMSQKDSPKEGGDRGSHDLPDLGDQMEAREREVASSANDSSSNVDGGNRVIGGAPMEDGAASGASDQAEKKPQKGSGIWPFSKKQGGGGGLFSTKSGLFGRKKRKKRDSSKGRMNYNEAEDSELKIDEDEIWRSKSQPIRQRGDQFFTDESSRVQTGAYAHSSSSGSKVQNAESLSRSGGGQQKDTYPTITETEEPDLSPTRSVTLRRNQVSSTDTGAEIGGEGGTRGGTTSMNSSEDNLTRSQSFFNYHALPFSPNFGGDLSGWMLHVRRRHLFGVTTRWFILSTRNQCLYKANSPLDTPMAFARIDRAVISLCSVGSRECISIESKHFGEDTGRTKRRFLTSDSSIQLKTWYNALQRLASQQSSGSSRHNLHAPDPMSGPVTRPPLMLRDSYDTDSYEFKVVKQGLTSFLSRVLFSLLHSGRDVMETHPYMKQVQTARRVIQLRDARWYHQNYQEMLQTFLELENEAEEEGGSTRYYSENGLSSHGAKLVSLAQTYARRMPSNLIQETLIDSSATQDEVQAVRRMERMIGTIYSEAYTTDSYDVVGRLAQILKAVDVDTLLKGSYHFAHIGDQELGTDSITSPNTIFKKRDVQNETALDQPAVKEAAQYAPLEHQSRLRVDEDVDEESESESDLTDNTESSSSSGSDEDRETEGVLRESEEFDSENEHETPRRVPRRSRVDTQGNQSRRSLDTEQSYAHSGDRISSLPPTFKCMHSIDVFASPNVMLLLGHVHHHSNKSRSAGDATGMEPTYLQGNRRAGISHQRSKFRAMLLDRRNDDPASLDSIVLWGNESVLLIAEEKKLLVDLIKQGKEADALQALRTIESDYRAKDSSYNNALAPFYDSANKGSHENPCVWDQQDWIELSTRGLIGSISFLKGYYLLFILKRKRVGVIGAHRIFGISEYLLLPVIYSNLGISKSIWGRFRQKLSSVFGHDDFTVAEGRYRSLFCQVDLGKDFYLSYTFDLTRHLQQQIQVGLASRSSAKTAAPGVNSATEPLHCEHGRFWGVSTHRTDPDERNSPVWNTDVDWGYYLSSELRQSLCARSRGEDTRKRNSHFLSTWVVPLVHGTFHQANVSMLGQQLTLTLIARRSRHFAGTRYLKRGVTSEGFVANDVEVEQILADAFGRYTSYVQMRGSVPVFWSQVADFKVPRPPVLMKPVDPHYMASKRHFYNLFERYGGPVLCLNLVKKKPRYPKEVDLSREFALAVRSTNDELPSCPEHRIQMLSLDFSELAKSPTHNVLQAMRDSALWGCNNTGFFASHPPRALLKKFGKRSSSNARECKCSQHHPVLSQSLPSFSPKMSLPVNDCSASSRVNQPLPLLLDMLMQRLVYISHRLGKDKSSLGGVMKHAYEIFLKEASVFRGSLSEFRYFFSQEEDYLMQCLAPWSARKEDREKHEERMKQTFALQQECIEFIRGVAFISFEIGERDINRALRKDYSQDHASVREPILERTIPKITAPREEIIQSLDFLRALIRYSCVLEDPGAPRGNQAPDLPAASAKTFRHNEQAVDRYSRASTCRFQFGETLHSPTKFLRKAFLLPAYGKRELSSGKPRSSHKTHERKRSQKSGWQGSSQGHETLAKTRSKPAYINSFVRAKSDSTQDASNSRVCRELAHGNRGTWMTNPDAYSKLSSMKNYGYVLRSFRPSSHPDYFGRLFDAEKDVFIHSHHHSEWTEANLKSFWHFSGNRSRNGIFTCPVQAARADESAFRTLSVSRIHTAVVPQSADEHSLIYRSKESVEQHKKTGCLASMHPEVGLAWRLLEAESVGRSDISVLDRLRRTVLEYDGFNPDELTSSYLREAESELLDHSALQSDPQNYLHLNVSGRMECEGSPISVSEEEEDEPQVLLQRGVMRSNCVDCLDRTNVAQCCFGLHVLVLQLQALGLVPVTEEPTWDDKNVSEGANEYMCQEHRDFPSSADAFGWFYPGSTTLHPRSTLARVCMEMYEDMGDQLALQYGGSEAHKKITSQSTQHDRILGKVTRRDGPDDDINESPFGPGAGSTTFYVDSAPQNVSSTDEDDTMYKKELGNSLVTKKVHGGSSSGSRTLTTPSKGGTEPRNTENTISFRGNLSGWSNGDEANSQPSHYGDQRSKTNEYQMSKEIVSTGKARHHNAFYEVGNSALDPQPGLHVSFREGVAGGKKNNESASNRAIELLTSIRRYVSNTIRDALKQDAMNIFLGVYQPKVAVTHLWDMDNDFLLHNGRKWWPILSVEKVDETGDAYQAVRVFLHRAIFREQWWKTALSSFGKNTSRKWLPLSTDSGKLRRRISFLSTESKQVAATFKQGLSYSRGGLAFSDSLHYKRSLNFLDEALSRPFFYPRKIMDWKRFGYVDDEALSKLWKHIGIEKSILDALFPDDKPASKSSAADNEVGVPLNQGDSPDPGSGTRNSVSAEDALTSKRSSFAKRSIEGSQFIRIADETISRKDHDVTMSVEERCRVPPWLRGRKDVYVDEAGEIGFLGQESGSSSSLQGLENEARDDDYKAYVVFPRTNRVSVGYGTQDSVGVEGIKVPVASRFRNYSVSDIEFSEMWKYAGVVIIPDYYKTTLVDYGSIVANVKAGRARGLYRIPEEELQRLDKFSSVFSRELARLNVKFGIASSETSAVEEVYMDSDKYDKLYTIMLPTDAVRNPAFAGSDSEAVVEARYQDYIREGLFSRQANQIEIRACVGKVVRCLCGQLSSEAIKDIQGSLASNINFDSTKDPFRRCSRNRGGKLSKGPTEPTLKKQDSSHNHGIDESLQAKSGTEIGYRYGAFRSATAAPFAQAGFSWDLVQLLGEFSITLYTRAAVEGAQESLDAMVSFLCRLGQEENSSFVPYNSQVSASSTFMNPEWHVNVDTSLCVADGKSTLDTLLGEIKKYVNDRKYAIQDPDPAGTHARSQLLRATKNRYAKIQRDPVNFYRQLAADSGWISKFHSYWKEMDVRDLFATQSLMKLVQVLKNIDFVLFRRDGSTHLPKHLIPRILVKPTEQQVEESMNESDTYHDQEYDLLYKESSNIGLSAGWYNCTMPAGIGMTWQLSNEDHSSFTNYCQKLDSVGEKARPEKGDSHSRYEDEEAPIPRNSWITEADKQLYKDYTSLGIHQGSEMPGKWYKARQIDVETLLAQEDSRKEDDFSQCIDIGFFNVSADNVEQMTRQQRKWGATYELLRHWRNYTDVANRASRIQDRAEANLQMYQQYTGSTIL